MQDIRLRLETTTSAANHHHHLQHKSHLNGLASSPKIVHSRPLNVYHSSCDDNNLITSIKSPSSEEDNSPADMNNYNCRRLVDKPPLVKRLTMGLLKSAEDSRPLVHNTSSVSSSGSLQTISDGYVNEAICDTERNIIASKFGDSCRQSLMSSSSSSSIVLDHNQFQSDANPVPDFEFQKSNILIRDTNSSATKPNPKMFQPTVPQRNDLSLTLAEQCELKKAPWYQAGIPREISLEVLSRQNPGAFLVRQSSSKPGCFALSLRVPPPAPKVAHYLIMRTPRGYKIKGFTKEFTSLRALITHHSVMPELLPVPLALPRPNNMMIRRDMNDPDTYSLNDFRKMMSDMSV